VETVRGADKWSGTGGEWGLRWSATYFSSCLKKYFSVPFPMSAYLFYDIILNG
jgi:hypothetical protein